MSDLITCGEVYDFYKTFPPKTSKTEIVKQLISTKLAIKGSQYRSEEDKDYKRFVSKLVNRITRFVDKVKNHAFERDKILRTDTLIDLHVDCPELVSTDSQPMSQGSVSSTSTAISASQNKVMEFLEEDPTTVAPVICSSPDGCDQSVENLLLPRGKFDPAGVVVEQGFLLFACLVVVQYVVVSPVVGVLRLALWDPCMDVGYRDHLLSHLPDQQITRFPNVVAFKCARLIGRPHFRGCDLIDVKLSLPRLLLVACAPEQGGCVQADQADPGAVAVVDHNLASSHLPPPRLLQPHNLGWCLRFAGGQRCRGFHPQSGLVNGGQRPEKDVSSAQQIREKRKGDGWQVSGNDVKESRGVDAKLSFSVILNLQLDRTSWVAAWGGVALDKVQPGGGDCHKVVEAGKVEAREVDGELNHNRILLLPHLPHLDQVLHLLCCAGKMEGNGWQHGFLIPPAAEQSDSEFSPRLMLTAISRSLRGKSFKYYAVFPSFLLGPVGRVRFASLHIQSQMDVWKKAFELSEPDLEWIIACCVGWIQGWCV